MGLKLIGTYSLHPKLQVGDRIKCSRIAGETFEGAIQQITSRFIAVKKKEGYTETILINDMLSREAVIEKNRKRVKLKLKQTRYVDKRSAVEMNADIRKAARIKKVHHQEIAKCLGMSPSTFSKLLRTKMSDDKKKEILRTIDTLAGGGQA